MAKNTRASAAAATPIRVGLYGIGLDTYWPQFKGLRERLVGYQARIAREIRRAGVELVDAGLVDNPDDEWVEWAIMEDLLDGPDEGLFR